MKRSVTRLLAATLDTPTILLSVLLVAAGAHTAGAAGAKFTALTAKMTAPRSGHTATLLPNGQVLLTGGDNKGGPSTGTTYNTAELYDPVANTFTALTARMTTAREEYAATLLCNGTVLIVGGFNENSDCFDTAEVYDPVANTFTALAATMTTARCGPTATILPDCQVLITGGDLDGVTLNTAELYDPVANTFTALTATMTTARTLHMATPLLNGLVLLTGGGTAHVTTEFNTAELYDPVANTFTALTATMTTPRIGHTATLLPNGQVLIAGGGHSIKSSPVILNTAEVYDPVANTFTALPATMTTARLEHAATRLLDGQVLLTGGIKSITGTVTALNTAELYTSGPANTATTTPTSTATATSTPAATSTITPTAPPSPTPTAPPQPNGLPCADDFQCASAHCTDGVCCSDASCPAGQSCNVPGLEGMCNLPATMATATPTAAPQATPTATPSLPPTATPQPNGLPCADDFQCASTHCTDGVCCSDASCPAGQSCNVPGLEGMCSLPASTPTITPTATQQTTPTAPPNSLIVNGTCMEPGLQGLVPCDAGTVVTASLCPDSSCSAPTLIALAMTQTDANGEFGFVLDATQVAGKRLVIGATIVQPGGVSAPTGGAGGDAPVDYRVIDVAPVEAATTLNEQIDPASKAAVQLVDDNGGAQHYSDAGVAEVIQAVRTAASGIDFAGSTAAGAVTLAIDTARNDPVVQAALQTQLCTGDCNGDGPVTVDEILTMVNIALGTADLSACLPGDANNDMMITVDEILAAVTSALNGCGG